MVLAEQHDYVAWVTTAPRCSHLSHFALSLAPSVMLTAPHLSRPLDHAAGSWLLGHHEGTPALGCVGTGIASERVGNE